MLSFIQERMKTRLSGWFSRIISLGGKEILPKSVAMALPVYAMSCFRLPKSTCSMVSSAMSDFWWNSREDKKKIHWVSWEKLCLSKDQGGLGFKDIESFNHALLGKQAWRIMNQPDSLLARFLKSRYFDQSEFLEASEGKRPSYGWRSILHGRELVLMGSQKKIGNGKLVHVWSERWIEGDIRRSPLMKNPIIDLNLKVVDLLNYRDRGWNRTKLKDLFYQEDITRIFRMKPVTSRMIFGYGIIIEVEIIQSSLVIG